MLSLSQKADLKEAFELFDTEGEGLIDNKDLKVAIWALGFEPTNEEMQHMILEVDPELTGKLSYDNFLVLMEKKMFDKDTNEEMLKAFRLFDDEGKGSISFQNLKRVATELGENLSDEELMEMIREADLAGTGSVDQFEFMQMMRGGTSV